MRQHHVIWLRHLALLCSLVLSCSCSSQKNFGRPFIEVDRFILPGGEGVFPLPAAVAPERCTVQVRSREEAFNTGFGNSMTTPILQSVVVSYEDLVDLIEKGVKIKGAPEGTILAALSSGELLAYLREGRLLTAFMTGWLGAYSYTGIIDRTGYTGSVAGEQAEGVISGESAEGEIGGEEAGGEVAAGGGQGRIESGEYRPHLNLQVYYRHHIPLLAPSQYLVLLSNQMLRSHQNIEVYLHLPPYLEVVEADAAGRRPVGTLPSMWPTGQQKSDFEMILNAPTDALFGGMDDALGSLPDIEYEELSGESGSWVLRFPPDWSLEEDMQIGLFVTVKPIVEEVGS